MRPVGSGWVARLWRLSASAACAAILVVCGSVLSPAAGGSPEAGLQSIALLPAPALWVVLGPVRLYNSRL